MSVENVYPRKWGNLDLEQFRITREDLIAFNHSEDKIASITDDELEEMSAVIRDNLVLYILPVEIENQVLEKLR